VTTANLTVNVDRPGRPGHAAELTLGYARAGAGAPVLLIHGNFASHLWWKEQLEEPPEGLLLLAPDLPNFRRSSPLPAGWPTGEWVYAWADAMAAFLGGLGVSRAGVVGHSLGGAVAQALAVRHPELVTALLLVDAAPPFGYVTPEEHYLALAAMRTDRRLLHDSLAAVTPTRLPAYFPALVDDALAMAPAAYEGNSRALAAYDLGAATTAVTVPVVVLHGAKDALIDAEAAAVTAGAYRDAELITWQDVGHAPPLEAPARFRALLAQTFGRGPESGGTA